MILLKQLESVSVPSNYIKLTLTKTGPLKVTLIPRFEKSNHCSIFILLDPSLFSKFDHPVNTSFTCLPRYYILLCVLLSRRQFLLSLQHQFLWLLNKKCSRLDPTPTHMVMSSNVLALNTIYWLTTPKIISSAQFPSIPDPYF